MMEQGAQDSGASKPETREDRQERISWWDQARLREAKVLVVGAGALGNEALKNLALVGVGTICIADCDAVELSNLSRAVLFREEDIGRRKAPVAAARAAEMNPHVRIMALDCDANYDIGLGLVRRMDAVLGCLDNLLARISVNRACFRVGVPYVDAGMLALGGQVRVFIPPDPPCYECTVPTEGFADLARRFSCPGLTRDDMLEGKAPTTQTISAIIAGTQVQEAVKLLHGLPVEPGSGLHFEGVSNSVDRTMEAPSAECYGHWSFDPGSIVEKPNATAANTTVREVVRWGEGLLGVGAAMELGRDIVVSFVCPDCETEEPVFTVRGRVRESRLPCPRCGEMRQFELLSGDMTAESPFADRTLAELSFPPLHILSARRGTEYVHFELTGDAPEVMGR